MNEEPVHRLGPTIPLPPYSYVPGHGLPHPINDPQGHSFNTQHPPHVIPELPPDRTSRRHALAAFLATNSPWLYALDLFNAGFYWEAHEAWEHFWNAFGRMSPEARSVEDASHITRDVLRFLR